MIKNINNFVNLTGTLNQFNSIYETLNELNQILSNYLPPHLTKFCHIGAIDLDKSIVVLFVSEQQAYHTLHNMANPILYHLTQHHYTFNNILIKVRQYAAPHDLSIKYKCLDSKYKNKLKKLAVEISKPELILDIKERTHKEIDF